MMLARLAFAASLLLATRAAAISSYVNRVPNGGEFECLTCHNSMSGGSRNVFGSAFNGAGRSWGPVCAGDADGDGQSNGEELGDPDCIWTSGAAAARTANLSNPGDAGDLSADPTGGSAVGEGEGEGDPSGEGEGEGDPSGEGEGEGDDGDGNDHDSDDDGAPAGCASTPAATLPGLALLLRVRRRRAPASGREQPKPQP